jgi:hypothetical protein
VRKTVDGRDATILPEWQWKPIGFALRWLLLRAVRLLV